MRGCGPARIGNTCRATLLGSPYTRITAIAASIAAPETSRIVVKDAGSIDPPPSARRHSSELAANAMSASEV